MAGRNNSFLPNFWFLWRLNLIVSASCEVRGASSRCVRMPIAMRPAVFFAVLALVLSYQRSVYAGPYVFGLDNRPSSPILGGVDPPGVRIPPGNGSEDPFGLVPSPVKVGPSPSLGTTLSDADILKAGTTGPIVDTMRPFNTNYVDAISSNRGVVDGRPLRLAFSVDRASAGVALSAVHAQFLLNQQPGDIFVSARDFPAPVQYVGTLGNFFGWVGNLSSVGSGSSNLLLLNQSQLKLRAGSGGFINSTTLAPPITPGSHDNVDAFDIAPVDISGDHVGDKQVYFSVNPDQVVLPTGLYFSAADIYQTAPGSTTPTLFASASSLGLNPFGDDLDALDLFDRGTVGQVDQGIDYALFSLAPGSQTLLSHSGLNAADIYFTDFSGAFATFASDADLGLNGTVNPAELDGGGLGGMGAGVGGTDNLDALSSYPLGDMDWSGSLSLDDVDDFVQGLTRPVDYRDVNIDHFGQPATILGDFSVPRDGFVDYDDVVPFRTAILAAVPPAAGASQIVPEPGTLFSALISLLALAKCRRRASSRYPE
jgi:hypothetical protein